MSWLRLVALLALAGALAFLFIDYSRLREVDHNGKLCVSAVTDTRAGKPAVLTSCGTMIAAAATDARHAVECDIALNAKPVDLYAIRATCSAPVKQVQASATALAADNDDLTKQLTIARDATSAAIVRAETRSVSNSTRKAEADAAIANSPASGAGAVTCDARCLRALAGGLAR